MSIPPEQDPIKREAPIEGDEAAFVFPASMETLGLDPSLLVSPLGVFKRPTPVGEEELDNYSPLVEGEDYLSLSPVAEEEDIPPQFAAASSIAENAEAQIPAPTSPVPAQAAAEIEIAAVPAIAAAAPGASTPPELLLFQSFYPEKVRTPLRIPNLGDIVILVIVAAIGWMGSGLITASALHYHLFGVATAEVAETDIHYTLISMTALYLISFAAGLIVFPLLWRKNFFAGVQWNVATALRLRNRMFGAACVCFVLAMIDGLLLPGPSDAPIDKLFQTKQAAWMLFAFGVTFAPFFEEVLFRGFLLPALSTALDWSAERFTGSQPRPLDNTGQPQWSTPSMVISSIAVSIPFAYMHADQTGHAIGPFILLVCVSMVLCWARLSTRSLAASVMVHASYNFLLFSLMLLGTGGFQHLDKM